MGSLVPRLLGAGAAGVRSPRGDGLAVAAGRLTVGWLLHHGGALAQTVFDGAGQPVGSGPIWLPEVRRGIAWRFSGGAVALLRSAEAIAAGRAATAALRVDLSTPLDFLLAEAMLERADRLVPHRRPGWAVGLAERAPLAALWRPGQVGLSPGGLDAWLAADRLLPYLEDHTIRRWLAAEASRAWATAGEHRLLNARLGALIARFEQAWKADRRPVWLGVLVRFYPRWLAARGGPGGVLRMVRSCPLDDGSVAAREAFEASFGPFLEPALRLVDVAAELRSYGWQRTPEEEHFLGQYSREFEPVAEALRGLHRSLCHII